MKVPDPEMTHYELDTLRALNGETVPGWISGASWLKSRGYAEGHYQISQKGRDYLAALSSPHRAALDAWDLVDDLTEVCDALLADLLSPFPREAAVVASLGFGGSSIERARAVLARAKGRRP